MPYNFVWSIIASKFTGNGTQRDLPIMPQSMSLSSSIGPRRIRINFWKHKQSLDEIKHRRDSCDSACFRISLGGYRLEEDLGVPELLRRVPLLDVCSAILVEGAVPIDILHHRAYIAAQMPRLEELGLGYESFDSVRSTSTKIQGPRGVFLDDNSASFFPQLNVLRVYELHHTGSVVRFKHISEYYVLARQLAMLQRFSQLDLSIERSDLHATIPQGFRCGSCYPVRSPRNARPEASRPSILSSLFAFGAPLIRRFQA